MNIYIGSDHAGFELKKLLIETLSKVDHTVIDCGAYSYNPTDDYPLYISKVARAISEAEAIRESEDSSNSSEISSSLQTLGIVIGGSGQGEAITANRFKYVRAVVCYGGEMAGEIVRLSRDHNNSNILSLGARFLSNDQAVELCLSWISTSFSGDERHARRIHDIEHLQDNDLLYN